MTDADTAEIRCARKGTGGSNPSSSAADPLDLALTRADARVALIEARASHRYVSSLLAGLVRR